MDATAESNLSYPWLRAYPPGIDWQVEFPIKPLYALFEIAILVSSRIEKRRAQRRAAG